MEQKNDAHVCIRNKEFVISGTESAEYIQKVAAYLNNKIEEVKTAKDYRNLDRDMKNIMLEINIVDELFKTRDKAEELEADGRKKEDELYHLKQEVVSMQTKMEELKEKLSKTAQAYESAQIKLKEFQGAGKHEDSEVQKQ